MTRLGAASPWCLSSSCHYLEAEHFDNDAVAKIAGAARSKRLYCYERASGRVAAALHWDDDGGRHQRLHAIALRGGAEGPVSGVGMQRVYAAGVFALGMVQYRARAAGKSGVLLASDAVEGGRAADLRALGFLSFPGGWRLEGPARWSSRLTALLALVRLRLTTRR